MSQPPARSLWGAVWKNFVNSLRPRKFTGDYKGVDYYGNKYYEIEANPSIGKRKPSRWFVPPVKDDFMNEMPAEWEAWLRGRRTEPPTEEELKRNLAIIKMKRKNALIVDAKAGKMTPMPKGIETFPKYTEYETVPGKGPQSGGGDK